MLRVAILTCAVLLAAATWHAPPATAGDLVITPALYQPASPNVTIAPAIYDSSTNVSVTPVLHRYYGGGYYGGYGGWGGGYRGWGGGWGGGYGYRSYYARPYYGGYYGYGVPAYSYGYYAPVYGGGYYGSAGCGCW